jgi:hypothetical protein
MIPHVGSNELHTLRQIRATSSAKIVYNPHIMSCSLRRVDRMRTDKPGASSYQYSHDSPLKK